MFLEPLANHLEGVFRYLKTDHQWPPDQVKVDIFKIQHAQCTLYSFVNFCFKNNEYVLYDILSSCFYGCKCLLFLLSFYCQVLYHTKYVDFPASNPQRFHRWLSVFVVADCFLHTRFCILASRISGKDFKKTC